MPRDPARVHADRPRDVRRAGRAAAHADDRARTRAGSGSTPRDVNEMVPDFTAVGATITAPQVFRGRTPFEIKAIARSARRRCRRSARQFSRTERLLLRFDAYGPAGTTPQVTLRLLNRNGRAHAASPLPALERARGQHVRGRHRPRRAAARRLPHRDRRRRRGANRRSGWSGIRVDGIDPAKPCASSPARHVYHRLLGLQVGALARSRSTTLAHWWTGATKAMSRRRGRLRPGEGGFPNPLATRTRLRHQFLRHARHRIVRADDRHLQVLQDGAGPADSRHAQRRPHAADDHAGVHLHR